MAVNKVVYGARTVIDLTDSTVTPETLAQGVVAYNKAGERIVGTMAGIPEIQTQGNWKYRIFEDGTFEAWYGATSQTYTITSQSGNTYRSELSTLALPTNLTNQGSTSIVSFNVGVGHSGFPVWTTIATKDATLVKYYVLSGANRGSNSNYTVSAYVFGTIS